MSLISLCPSRISIKGSSGRKERAVHLEFLLKEVVEGRRKERVGVAGGADSCKASGRSGWWSWHLLGKWKSHLQVYELE